MKDERKVGVSLIFFFVKIKEKLLVHCYCISTSRFTRFFFIKKTREKKSNCHLPSSWNKMKLTEEEKKEGKKEVFAASQTEWVSYSFCFF